MLPFEEHPERRALVNELHARPFQPMTAPGRVLHLAFQQPAHPADRDEARDRAHLTAILDRHGAAHPAPGANHHAVTIGRVVLTWERHTEFVSYTVFEAGGAGSTFDAGLAGYLTTGDPSDAPPPGKLIAAIQCELVSVPDHDAALAVLDGPIGKCFSGESLACAWVADGEVLAIGDFRLDENGYSRFALAVVEGMGPRRIGRVCQRLLEMDVYRSLAMLALPIARSTVKRLNEIETALAALIGQVALDEDAAPEGLILAELTELSAEIEALSADAAFRFGAAGAYEAIVHQRIEMLTEARVRGRQLFRDFMLRRFDPAMRTIHAAERRLGELAVRGSRASELLRTRVNVVLEAQNRDLLSSMDRRAALQLRLQETVEGLSVVAISYYAVSLAGYLLAPFAKALGVDKTVATAVVCLPVILGVWWFVRRLRRRIEKR